MTDSVSITALGSISPLGLSTDQVWASYLNSSHKFVRNKFNEKLCWVSALEQEQKDQIALLKKSDPTFNKLDASVLYAVYAARVAVKEAGWKAGDNFGINIGSSRGATGLFEKYYKHFLSNKIANTLASPTTTLGNISSWVAHDLQSKGPTISHSITCSTALHALINGLAWINSGMSEKFLVGGSEAPLTAFTVSQMQALKIYADSQDAYPCRALDFKKKNNTMILGEGASMVCLEKGRQERALAQIEGIGFATEILQHPTSISANGDCFHESMKMALAGKDPDSIDLIIMHAPGTRQGDISEYNAICKVFTKKIPALSNNKWKLGHTLGASGMFSLELAVLTLKNQKIISSPFYLNNKNQNKIDKILVNAVGFGGNAVSILLSGA